METVITGHLAIKDTAVAVAAIDALGGTAPPSEKSVESLMPLLCDLLDGLFPPSPSPGGPFMLHAEPCLTKFSGPDGWSALVGTRPEEWTREGEKAAIVGLERLAGCGVAGYVEIRGLAGGDDTYPERQVIALAPFGLIVDAMPVES